MSSENKAILANEFFIRYQHNYVYLAACSIKLVEDEEILLKAISMSLDLYKEPLQFILEFSCST